MRLTKTLAHYIEGKLQTSDWQRCIVYDEDLARLWPIEQIDRAEKIREFAKEYGFGLKFYRKGICAIFVKEPSSLN